MKMTRWGSAAVCAAGMLLSYSIVFLDRQTIAELVREDGFFENLSAVCWLLASAGFALLYFKRPAVNDLLIYRTKRNIFYLLLALLFFFAAGEEISWGQRIFHLETPAAMKAVNMQGEINLHNLKPFHRLDEHKQDTDDAKLLNFDRLFSLFWLLYCFLVPLSTRGSARAARLVRRVALPRVPLAVGVFFPLNYLLAKSMEKWLAPELWHTLWRLTEMKECVFAFLFLMVAVSFLARADETA